VEDFAGEAVADDGGADGKTHGVILRFLWRRKESSRANRTMPRLTTMKQS
jgi:hypothetical protein